jgi:threonylcarbamoyladenosine tRNA methylthiotransferase MtaB
MNLYFFSFGCKVNQVEFENLKMEAILNNINITKDISIADFIIVNSCAVTEQAVNKLIFFIKKMKKNYPNAKILVTGCAAELKKEELKNNFVDLIVTNAGKSNLLSYIKEQKDFLKSVAFEEKFENVGIAGSLDKTRGFLKIQDGCNSFCSYCIIPTLRGKPRSKQIDEVKDEFKTLLQKGFKEIVLVGIHIGKYGLDLNVKLYDLLKTLVKIKGDYRIRLSSLEVTEISEEIINLIKNNPTKICRHFHIPLQSGSDTILKRMNRDYLSKDYINTVKKIKYKIPEVTIGSDVIVGFPGETEENFKETLNTLEEAAISYLHVFPFSLREGTKAFEMDNKIDERVISERAKILRKYGEAYKFNAAKKFANKTLRVLTEKNNKGLTDNYFQVIFPKDIEKNQFINAKIFGVQIDGVLAGVNTNE